MADEVQTETPAEEVQAPVETPEVPAEPVEAPAPEPTPEPVPEEAPAPSIEEMADGGINEAAKAISNAPIKGATKKINLRYNFKTYNTAEGNFSFGPGEVEVPEGMVDDLLAREAEYDRIERAKHESIDLTIPVGNLSA